MTRDQLRKCFRLGKVRNANRVLGELSDYLASVREGFQTVYYLNKEGRAYVGCEKIRKRGGHMYHTILRNDAWLFYGCPSDWKNEVKVSDGMTTVITDAMFMKALRYHFLEIDRMQSMKENKLKIARYKELERNGLIKEKLGHFPMVVFITTTELRRKQLQEACKALPNTQVYTIADIK